MLPGLRLPLREALGNDLGATGDAQRQGRLSRSATTSEVTAFSDASGTAS